jgi:glyoxylase-like metal-dependent hydrolase (beta-lactamase superfamily II)
VAIVDPGPDLPEHVRAVVRSVEDAERVRVLLTHGHGDHAGAVDALLARLPGAEVLGAGHPSARPLASGEAVPTDSGALTAVPTPGHARDHLAFLWESGSALFAGDLVLGVGDTTWVGEYPGCVADYLASLDRIEALDVARIFPAHGPDILDPPRVLAAYRVHRRSRIEQVRRLRNELPAAQVDEMMGAVYGTEVPTGLASAARASLQALIEYVDQHPDEEAG